MKHFELEAETDYQGYTVKIMQDIHGENPRLNSEYLGTMLCGKHWNYNLGDVQKHNEEIVEKIKELEKNGGLILPLYLYDHSGITMNTHGFSCQFDSGEVGIIYVEREKILNEFNCKRVTKKIKERVYNIMREEVKEYDHYLTGNVWGYAITNSNGDEIGSCWGFYGDGYGDALEYMEGNIIGEIEYDQREKLKERQNLVKTWIKHKVPLVNRQQMISI